MASLPHVKSSQTGTTQTAGARNKGGNFIGQLCISVDHHFGTFFIYWNDSKYSAILSIYSIFFHYNRGELCY